MQQQPEPQSLAVLQTAVAEHGAALRRELEALCKAAGETLAAGFSSLASVLLERTEALLRYEHEAGQAEGRSETLAALLSGLRRMQAAESRSEWAWALADAAAAFAPRVAVVLVRGEELEVIAGRDPDRASARGLPGVRFPLYEASAFRSVIETGEPVVTQRTSRELSEEFARAVGAAGDGTAWLLPVRTDDATVAVLYADGPERVAEAGLELAATMAGWIARARRWPLLEEAFEAARPPAPPRELPDWSRLSREEQELHLRAQRFARVQVAEIRLHHDEAVRAGRAQRNLYRTLKQEIEQAREAFRRQFVEASPTMVDYLHRELLRTLAHEDAALLGEDYPGPLV